eukprot:365993-Chlamydomonas_euryale.AAC.7
MSSGLLQLTGFRVPTADRRPCPYTSRIKSLCFSGGAVRVLSRLRPGDTTGHVLAVVCAPRWRQAGASKQRNSGTQYSRAGAPQA